VFAPKQEVRFQLGSSASAGGMCTFVCLFSVRENSRQM
jgi:hypothetical protein